MIRWEPTADGIVVLTLDDPEQSTNTMNDRFMTAVASTVDRLEAERDSITGVVLTSAKEGFLAGADLKSVVAASAGADQATMAVGGFEACERLKAMLRRLEKLGRPVVAEV